MNDKYDIIIIGSGLGGLLSGFILSKNGYNVCILEKNPQIGGTLQSFKRDGCVFDTGMHYIGSLNDGQILNRFFRYFNLLNNVKIRKLDEDGFDVINIDNKIFKYAMGYERFENKLISYFPNEKTAIKTYINKIREVADSEPMYNLRIPDLKNLNVNPYMRVNTHKYIESLTSNNELQNVLAALNYNYAGRSDNTPLYVHAFINNYYINSAYRFVDGSDQIARILASQIINNGGTILKNRKVKEFVFKGSKLIAIDDTTGNRYFANSFISNIHPAQTLGMIDPGRLRKVYRNRINSLENTVSAFSVYINLKENTFPYINSNYYYSKRNNVWSLDYYNERNWPENYFFYTPAFSTTNKYSRCVGVVTFMKYNEVKKWEDTSVEERGTEYIDWKRTKAEKLIALVTKQFPELEKNITGYYTSTPLTYRDYIGNGDGSIYGILRNCNNPLESVISPRSSISNLFFTGQNINLHGMLGVTISAVITAGEFVGLRNLIRSINNA